MCDVASDNGVETGGTPSAGAGAPLSVCLEGERPRSIHASVNANPAMNPAMARLRLMLRPDRGHTDHHAASPGCAKSADLGV